MAFWSDPNLREPLRQNRWYMLFGDNLLDNYRFALKECSKPEYKIETTPHVLLNHTFNYPKNLVWQPIQVKMVSARAKLNNLVSVLQARLDTNGYTIPSSTGEQKQLSKNLMAMSTSIYQIDANGALIEKWNLNNAFISNLNYGALTYENDGFVDVSFTITYDFAELDIAPARGVVDFNIQSTTTSGAPGTVTAKYANVTEEQVADKILNKAAGIEGTNGQIKSINGLSPGFPGQKK